MGFDTPVWPKSRFILACAVSWGLSWALGLQIVYGLDPAFGWIGIGTLGGLASAVVLRRSGVCRNPGRLALVVAGWMAGGCASAAFATYDVTTGWIGLGILGGAAMGWAVAGNSFRTGALPAIAAAAGWVAAGVIGDRIQANWGREIGVWVGQAVPGLAAPYIVWSVAWGVGGLGVGGLGGAVVAVLWKTCGNNAGLHSR